MESANITEIILDIIDNACSYTSTSSQETTDEKYVSEIIAQIIDVAYENYAPKDSFAECDVLNIDQTHVISSTSHLSESDIIGTHDKNQVIVYTMETIPELFESTAIEINDENREIAGETTESVSTVAVGINDENQVVIPTSETLKVYESSVTEINEKDQMNVSTAETAIKINDKIQVIVATMEMIPERFESTVIEINDANKVIVESTNSANTETMLTAVIGKNYENEVNVTPVTRPELSESETIETNNENQELAESTAIVNKETVSTAAIGNVENQIIVSTAETLTELIPFALKTIPEIRESEAFENNNEYIGINVSTLSANTENVSIDVIGINNENRVIVLMSEMYPELKESDAVNDENQIFVPATETLLEVSESKAIDDENEVINESTVSAESVSTVPVTSSSAEADKGNKGTVNRRLEVVMDVNRSTNDFYTDDLLRRKGYVLDFFDNLSDKTADKIILMLNLSLPTVPAKELNWSEVRCDGLPFKITVNELIPLLEKAGNVYKLRMVENSGRANVTYATEKEAEIAIKTFNNKMVRGRIMAVRKFLPALTLFVAPIPVTATKTQIFNQFSSITRGLDKVLLFNSFEDDRKNRGFCYLDYESNKLAAGAKKVLSGKTFFNKTIVCEWPDRTTMEHSADTLFVNNLGAAIRTADLRKHFSVFGEVMEIDKNGNYASIVFRNPKDSKRALRSIDKRNLGNENVEVSDFVLTKKQSDQHGERFLPRNDPKKSPDTTSYDKIAPRAMNTNQNSFGAGTNRRRDIHSDRNGRCAGPHSPMTQNQSARRDPCMGRSISKEGSFRSDTNNRPDSRNRTFSAGPAEQYGTRKDTKTSNTVRPATNEPIGSRQGILTSNENKNVFPEFIGPPKSKPARNAFDQSQEYPKQH